MTYKKIELVLVAFAVVGFLLNMLALVPFGSMLMVLGLGCLATYYFISGLSIFNVRPAKGDEATKTDIGFKIENIAGVVFALVIVALLFNIQSWPMAGQYTTYGLVGTGILLIWIALKYYGTKTYDAVLLKRTIIYACLLMVLMLLPPFTLINIKYRAHPAYREALKESIQHPADTALRAKMMEGGKLNAGK